MVRNKDRWSQLSMRQRADLIKLYIDSGITDLNSIRDDYNRLDGTEDEQTLSGEAVLVGKVPFNPFKTFNRNYRGTNIYEADEFSKAFRQARIDKQERFIFNDKVYSTELAPNMFVEAAKNWDTEGNLSKEDFRMQIIRNPNEVLKHYNKQYPSDKYKSANKE